MGRRITSGISVLMEKHVIPSLISKLCGNQDLHGVQQGIANEQEGIKAFKETTGMKASEGLVCGWLTLGSWVPPTMVWWERQTLS